VRQISPDLEKEFTVMRVLAFSLLLALAPGATASAQSYEYQSFGCGAEGGMNSACGPQARNSFGDCGCNCGGNHAGGYGCCPRPACDGSIWTSTYYPRTNTLHLWDTYCAERAEKKFCGQEKCQLHSYHTQQPCLSCGGGYAPSMHLMNYSTPHSVPYPAPLASDRPTEIRQSPAPAADLPAQVPPPGQGHELDDSPLDAGEHRPLLAPDAVQLSPAENSTSPAPAPPQPKNDVAPSVAPELNLNNSGSPSPK
jgi:hypothetical protein